MIPVRLEIKNFLPYTMPDPVRFEGIHLACLTGNNGAGKSSLLDAITWALWGKARAKRDDELVHLGQTDMYVQLDFEQEGAQYRVLRRRARGKRGQGTLDLFVFREDDSPNNISERHMRATQAKIDDLLRLDYETFVHSAFLQQGKADAFTTKNPSERKKILSDILGLDQWTIYEDRVKAHLKEVKANLTYFGQRISEIDAELAKKPMRERERDDAETRHKDAEAAHQRAREQLEALAHVPAELRAAQDSKTDRERRLKDHQSELQNVAGQIERVQSRIDDYQEVIAAKDEIEQGYAALQSAREANQALSDTLIKLRTIEDERATLRSQLASARARLESEIEASQRRITELEAMEATDYAAELESVQAEVVALQAQEADRDRLTDQINALKEESAGLRGGLQAIEAEGKELRDRLDRLQAAADDAAMCPLCGQPLGPAERTKLIDDLNDDVEQRREDYRHTQERITTIATEVKALQGDVKAINADLDGLSALRERVGVLGNQAETARQAAAQLAEERSTLEAAQTTLENGDFAADVQARLAELDSQHADLGYDEDDHAETREQLDAHTQYESLHARLQVALESLPGLETDRTDALARQERLRQAEANTQAEITQFDADITRLTEQAKEYAARKSEAETQAMIERDAYDKLKDARQALDALAVQAERKAEFEIRLDAAREEDALYTELRNAFGKNGVPAMIIETAIPELETAANDLLSRMTDGRMHLRLTTQREKVTGGMAETLDIEIADELGTRSYELYSGGEAFRINFAIRVALSKMLARRAGAHLRTLFIDEGFGTQDASGRTKLVEAINAIQEEFDLILVITHIDELRDSFPVHIVVEKAANGSTIGVR